MYNAAEIFRNKTGAIVTHVPFRGGPDGHRSLQDRLTWFRDHV